MVRELHEIRERIDSLIETLEVSSDKEFLAEIRESLRESKRGEGRSIGELIEDLERLIGE